MVLRADFLSVYGPAALITGASSGIGREFARELAMLGFDLVLVARRRERLDQLAAELRVAHQREIRVVAADLADSAQLHNLADWVSGMDIGLLVSNAGFGLKGGHECNDAQVMNDMVAVNCIAPMQLTHALIPGLKKRGHGGILLTGSIEGFIGFPWSAAYAASKAFVGSLGEALWVELREAGIDVTVLCPGSTDTEALPLQGFDKSRMAGLMTPRAVAQTGLERLGRGPTVVAGWPNRLLMGVLRALPRRLALRIAGKAMDAALRDRPRQPGA